MTFTKKKLAAVVSGSLLMGVGIQGVQAQVNLDNNGTTAANPNIYATEILVAATGTTLVDTGAAPAGIQDIIGTLSANQIASDTDIRVTLTLGGDAVFAAQPAMLIGDGSGGNGCLNGTASIACPAVNVFSGGTTADNSVVFDTNTGTGTVAPGAFYEIDVTNLNITGQGTITATIGIALADNFGPVDLPGVDSASYISFSPLLSVTADLAGTAVTTESIDVTQDSLFFSGGTGGDVNKSVGGINVTESTSGNLGTGSTALSTENVIASYQKTLIAANGFSAFNQGTSVAGESINIGAAGNNTDATMAVSTSDTTMAVAAAATVGTATLNNGDATATQIVSLTVPTANTVAIAETTLQGSVAVTGAATGTYSTATSTGTVDLTTLARNGSSARLSYALTPGGAFPMWIRVTNPASIAGPVTLTLTNDDGDTSAAIPLSDIEGFDGAELAAGQSTGLLPIQAVFDAVQAADATFDLGATNKLRVDVVAEFGTTNTTTGVILGAFSQSSDGTTFNMMTDASN